MHLLDTSVILWAATNSRHLGSRAREMIKNSGAVHFSAVSIAEITIKSMLGKLDVPSDLDSRLVADGLRELPVAARHAAAVRKFPQLIRHDPFDRLLLTQAAVDGLTLLTADRALLALGLDYVVDARE